jgi:thymidylate kinase
MKNKKKPMIITFIGPVGVGKSTQITLFEQYLKNSQFKTKKTYINSVHLLAFVLSALVEMLVNIGDIRYRNKLKKRIYNQITPIWTTLDEFSIASKFLFSVYIPYKLGYNILIEEGLLMSIEYYEVFRPYFLDVKPIKLKILNKLLMWTNNQKYLVIILNANTDEIYERRKSRRFRRFEKDEYDKLHKIVISKITDINTINIDTSSKKINEIQQIIINEINKFNN